MRRSTDSNPSIRKHSSISKENITTNESNTSAKKSDIPSFVSLRRALGQNSGKAKTADLDTVQNLPSEKGPDPLPKVPSGKDLNPPRDLASEKDLGSRQNLPREKVKKARAAPKSPIEKLRKPKASPKPSLEKAKNPKALPKSPIEKATASDLELMRKFNPIEKY